VFNNQLRTLAPEERDVLLYLLLVSAIARCRRPTRPDRRHGLTGSGAGQAGNRARG
jgi:hypothetical protein